MNILLADDDTKLHMVIHLWLQRNGHRMVVADNGHEALALIEQEDFDVLISDVNMPLLNGMDLVKSVLAGVRIPALIILMTSRCDSAAIADEIDCPQVRVLNKPFSPRELAALIENLGAEQTA